MISIWFVPTNTTIERVASKSVLEGGDVVSAKHCQGQYKMKVYTLRQVYKKRTRKQKHPNKKNTLKYRSL